MKRAEEPLRGSQLGRVTGAVLTLDGACIAGVAALIARSARPEVEAFVVVGVLAGGALLHALTGLALLRGADPRRAVLRTVLDILTSAQVAVAGAAIVGFLGAGETVVKLTSGALVVMAVTALALGIVLNARGSPKPMKGDLRRAMVLGAAVVVGIAIARWLIEMLEAVFAADALGSLAVLALVAAVIALGGALWRPESVRLRVSLTIPVVVPAEASISETTEADAGAITVSVRFAPGPRTTELVWEQEQRLESRSAYRWMWIRTVGPFYARRHVRRMADQLVATAGMARLSGARVTGPDLGPYLSAEGD